MGNNLPLIEIRELLAAGVHFGHKTQRWNPTMRRFIFGARNGIHIIDLQHTVRAVDEADAILVHLVQNGGRVIFVGTKRQARDAVREAADNSAQYYVNQRWLGGTLTNFQTIKHRLQRLRELRVLHADGASDELSKRDMHTQLVELNRLERKMGGLATMTELPDVLFLIDPRREHIAVNEARVLGIPVVALVDTNCNPDDVDLPIPGNDDSIRSIRLILERISQNVAAAFEQYETVRIERETAERIEHERQEKARREVALKRQEAEAQARTAEAERARASESPRAAAPAAAGARPRTVVKAPAAPPAPGAKPTQAAPNAQAAAKSAEQPQAKAAAKSAEQPAKAAASAEQPKAKAAAKSAEQPQAKAAAKTVAKAASKTLKDDAGSKSTK